jgi:hypothetical protein
MFRLKNSVTAEWTVAPSGGHIRRIVSGLTDDSKGHPEIRLREVLYTSRLLAPQLFGFLRQVRDEGIYLS